MNEFTLINDYLKPLSKKNMSSLNLSDDIYYDFKNKIAISVDTYVEGEHFLDSSNPKKFLKKILRASLSDLYCKGIKPTSYFLSLALNKKLARKKWLKQIKNILNSEQKKFNIHLGGGDTTKSSKLIITIIVKGFSKIKPVLRHTSKINNDIYVTGNIADSYLGLMVLKKKSNYGKFNKYFIKKYYEPELQTKFFLHLPKIATASIDVSDGVGADLKHLCQNSNCGALISLDLLPLSSYCKILIKSKKIQLKNIFSNGDDYQILFTSNIKNRLKIASLSKKLGIKITRIGRIIKGKNILFKQGDNLINLKDNKMGHIHNF